MAVYPWQKPAAPATPPSATKPVVVAGAAPAKQPAPALPPREPGASHPLTIVRLTAENVKRLRAVTIEPDGSLVVLGGRNAQGKSSVLDSIEWALGGKPDVAEPVRRGEGTAEIVCDLGDLIVRRRFTAGGGTTLEVTSREGLKYPSPQKILDDLVGRLTFDPLAFARQKPEEQQRTLQQLVGLDFAGNDAQADDAYAARTAVNREIKAAQARMHAMPDIKGLPEQPVSASEIVAEMQRAQTQNNENARRRSRTESAKDKCAQLHEKCTRLRDDLARAAEELQQASNALEAELQQVATLVDIDVAPFTQRIADADQTNQKIRVAKERRQLAVDLEAKQEQAAALTATIDGIAAAKEDAIATAKMPIEGLGFGAAGVTLNGLPLDQGSGAEQLRVSVAIGLAMNPRLRVLLIRDASLLDTESLRLVGEMAAAAGAQCWLERVESDASTTVLIEDGQVVAQEAKEGAA